MGKGWQRQDKAGASIRTMLALCALLLLLAGARAARADGLIKGTILSVGLGPQDGQNGIYRPGSWVPVLVSLQNRSGKTFDGRLGVDQSDLDGDRVTTISAPFVLPASDANDRIVWAYYWPTPDDELHGIKSVLVLDSHNATVATITTQDKMTHAVGIPLEDGTRSSRCVILLSKQTTMGWLNFREAGGGTENVRLAQLETGAQIPDDVKGLEAVDAIVWAADQVLVSDIPEKSQSALLEWVKGGGHLIISVGTQGQTLAKADKAMAGAMPIELTDTRSVKFEALAGFPGCGGFGARLVQPPVPGDQMPFVQALGTVRAGARPIALGALGDFAQHPLAVTGLFGRGAITMLTFDAGNSEMQKRLDGDQWMAFWDQVAGWAPGPIHTRAELDAMAGPPQESREFQLLTTLAQQVDVTDQTQQRVLVAILFLAAYWLVAGPLGHLVLRHYKLIHWSWWIFGATVVVATSVAGVVVLLLHVSTNQLRHRSYVLGTVNSPEVTVLGFYGVYSPASGPLNIRQLGARAGSMSYLMPMSLQSLRLDEVKPYADPQSYEESVEDSSQLAPIFRNTLKKLEGRWTGDMPGINGTARYTGDPMKEISGDLVNNSNYDLDGVKVVVYRPRTAENPRATSHLYRVGLWRKGDHLDLEKMDYDTLDLRDARGKPSEFASVEKYLQVMGWHLSESVGHMTESINTANLSNEEQQLLRRDVEEDLLAVLLDMRTPDDARPVVIPARMEPIRGVARLLDATKELHAAGAVIIAHAGHMEFSPPQGVDSPVPITIGDTDRPIVGKGEVTFVWALPVEAAPRAATAPGQTQPEGRPVGAAAPISPVLVHAEVP